MTDELALSDLPQPEEETSVPPEVLHVDGDNPNVQNDAMFGLLCENMRAKGWIGNAIVANTGDLPGYDGDPEGLIADGEHRWRAAQEIGLEDVPVKLYDFEDDAERRLWRQELNKISGTHDTKRDALELDYLLQEGRSDDVQDLVEATDEDLDELLAEIRVDKGAAVPYEYDPEHNVYFEDCVEGMRNRLEDDSVDCVITDPPYGIDYSGGHSDHGEMKFNRLESDEDLEGAVELYRDALVEMKRVLKPDGHLYTFTRWDVYPAFLEATADLFDVRNCLVWAKNNHGLGDLVGQYGPQHEFIIFAAGDEGRPLQAGRPGDVFNYSRTDTKEYDHPTQKPLDLIVDLLTNSTNEGDLVLDPFMGAGTTAVASIQHHRDYVGFEINAEDYQESIERRVGEAKRQLEAAVNVAAD